MNVARKRGEKVIQSFSRKTRRQEGTLEALMNMGE